MKSLDFIRLREAPATTITSTTSANVPGNPQSHPNYQTYLQQELAKNNRGATATGQQIAATMAANRVQKELAQAKSGEQISVNGAPPVQVGGGQAAQAPAAPEIVPPGFVPASSTPPAQTIRYDGATTQPVAPLQVPAGQPVAQATPPVATSAGPRPPAPTSTAAVGANPLQPATTPAAPAPATTPVSTATSPYPGGISQADAERKYGKTGAEIIRLGGMDAYNKRPKDLAGNLAYLNQLRSAKTATPAAPQTAAVQDPRAGRAESVTKKDSVLEYKNMTAAEKIAHFRNLLMEAPPRRGNPPIPSSPILGPNGTPLPASTPTASPSAAAAPAATTGTSSATPPTTGASSITVRGSGNVINVYNGLTPEAQTSLQQSSTRLSQAGTAIQSSRLAKMASLWRRIPLRKTAVALGIAYAAKKMLSPDDSWSGLFGELAKQISIIVTDSNKAIDAVSTGVRQGTEIAQGKQLWSSYIKDIQMLTSSQENWDFIFADNPNATPEEKAQQEANRKNISEKILCLSQFFKDYNIADDLKKRNAETFDFKKYVGDWIASNENCIAQKN